MNVQYRIPCVKKATVNCTLEYVLIYFRIRAQVAYILIMLLAKWTTEWFNIFFSLVLLQGKKIFVHNILTKKKSFKGNIKEKKFMLHENPPPPP